MANIKKSWDGNERPYYHFTTFDTFCRIYDSGKIRLSPCNSAKNAAVEVMALYGAIKKVIETDQNLKNTLLHKYSLREVKELLDKLIEHRIRSYMVCFSTFDQQNEKEEISKAEFLWKFYADNSRGVVIKFNYQCYPFRKHGSEGMVVLESESGNEFRRSTEIRIDHVIYDDEIRLKKFIEMGEVLHPFATDVYKPKICAIEKEIRMLVYLYDKQDLYKLDGISESSANNLVSPEYLYYDFKSKETSEIGKGIQKVFCRNEEIREKLLKKCGEEMIEVIE